LTIKAPSPETGRRIHFWMMVFWGINIVLIWFLPQSWQIPYLIVVSIYANFVGHWSGWSAERPSEVVKS
jgi:hypothetical protein